MNEGGLEQERPGDPETIRKVRLRASHPEGRLRILRLPLQQLSALAHLLEDV